MKQAQKGFANIVLVVILVGILIGVVGYWIISRNMERKRFIERPQPTLDWKTYDSPNWHFTMQYPADSQIDENYHYDLIQNVSIHGVSFSLPVKYWQGTNLGSDSKISVEVNEKTCGAKNFVNGMIKQDTTEVINGKTYNKTISTDAGAGNFYTETVYSISAPWSKNVCYGIRLFLHSSNLSVLQENNPNIKAYDSIKIDELFNQFLSTFKFIQPTINTSNWKTYTNSQYGFEFSYPSIYKTNVISGGSAIQGEISIVRILDITKDAYVANTLSLSIWDNSKQLSLLDWATQNSRYSNYGPNSFNTDFKNEVISGHKTISYKWQGEGYGKTVLIENNQIVLLLDTVVADQGERVWKDFDSIFSTFKFTN